MACGYRLEFLGLYQLLFHTKICVAKCESYHSYYRATRTKMRFMRIKAKILASQSVALVSARAVSVSEMADFGRKMQSLFANWGGESQQNLIIINIHNNDDFAPTQIEKRVYKIRESLQIIEFYCNDKSLSEKRAFLGNTLAWHRIMCQLAINR